MDEKIETWNCWNCLEYNCLIKLKTEKEYYCQSCGTPKDTTINFIIEYNQ